jgi:hypothetical protein
MAIYETDLLNGEHVRTHEHFVDGIAVMGRLAMEMDLEDELAAAESRPRVLFPLSQDVVVELEGDLGVLDSGLPLHTAA